jgi:hypothetical protein
MNHPEHDKLKRIARESQLCGEFLDWLNTEKHLELCQLDRDLNAFLPFSRDYRELLAEFFGIDSAKLEAEKLEMLKELRRRET